MDRQGRKDPVNILFGLVIITVTFLFAFVINTVLEQIDLTSLQRLGVVTAFIIIGIIVGVAIIGLGDTSRSAFA